MQEIAAYLLLKVAGKDGSAEEVTSVVEAAGGAVDEAALTTMLGDLDGKDINELWAAGMEKLKDVPMGGGGGGGGGAAAGGAAEAEEEKEEEKPEEEEMDLGGGMDMFGGGDEGGDDY